MCFHKTQVKLFFFAASLIKTYKLRKTENPSPCGVKAFFFLQETDFPFCISLLYSVYSSTKLVHLPLAPQGRTPPEVTGRTTS